MGDRGGGTGRRIMARAHGPDLEDALDLHGHAERQRRRADGGAAVPPGIAQRLDQEIRRAVDHLGLVAEIAGGVDEARQLHHPHQPVEIAAAGRLDLRQKADRADLGRGGTVRDVHVRAKLADDEGAIAMGTWPET
jgi:hypothetical protein